MKRLTWLSLISNLKASYDINSISKLCKLCDNLKIIQIMHITSKINKNKVYSKKKFDAQATSSFFFQIIAAIKAWQLRIYNKLQ